jgi:hypothetical protein
MPHEPTERDAPKGLENLSVNSSRRSGAENATNRDGKTGAEGPGKDAGLERERVQPAPRLTD